MAEPRRPRHRLPPDVRPRRVHVRLEVDPAVGDRFRGEVTLDLHLERPRRAIRLHAKDLRVKGARVRGSRGPMRGTLRELPEVEMIEVRFDEAVPRGEATLELGFAGRLRRDLCGLYGARVGERRYAFTQLEATEARKFFPCFDEPAMKARFLLEVTTGAGNAVVSNAPVRRVRRAGPGRKRVEFQETPPLSSYLVALAVGELERTRPVRVGPTEIRVWTTPGKRRLGAFGLEAARACLERLERWFALPYPYAKLDLVAVPDFEFGAMENAGAVFFRETLLLLDPATATLNEHKRAAEVIAHELAHMWYGNLVTMAWWDDLWLNEAFATWMAFVVVDDWKPEWRMWHDFQHGVSAALELDALRHTHPVYSPVRSAAEANENFDLITYEKGAAVVRMLERYLGAGRFRRGVRRYVRRHREGNAVASDLWRALAEVSGEPVEALARAWIEQEGHPLLRLRRVRGPRGHALQVGQERFLERPPRDRGPTQRWPIPWVGCLGSGRGPGTRVRHLVVRRRERIELGARAPRFVYGNADEGGFFRPLHEARELSALLDAAASLPAVERMGLVDHQWALVRAGRAEVGSFLEVASVMARDRDPDVVIALQRPLGFLADHLVPDAAPDAEPAFRRWVEERFGPPFDALGWDPARGEGDDERMRRAALLGILGDVAASPPVLEEAARRCELYLADRRAIDPNLADPVVHLAARQGGLAWHARMVRSLKQAQTPQEVRRFLLSLGSFRARGPVRRSLALSLTPTVATQDVVFLLLRLLANPAARDPTWHFVRRHWRRLQARTPSLLASRLVDATWQLLTPQRRREVARFFREHPVPSGERALRQALERFDWYRGFRRGAGRELEAWLDRRAVASRAP